MIITIFLEYGSLKKAEYKKAHKYISMHFADTSNNRILIKKQDKTAFTEEDYAKIEKQENVDYIVKNDWFIDNPLILYEGKVIPPLLENDGKMIWYDYNIYEYGKGYDISRYKGKLDVGRMPENKNEVILKIDPEYKTIKGKENEVLNHPLEIKAMMLKNLKEYEYKTDLRVKIVGIEYNIEMKDENAEIYASSELLEELNMQVNGSFTSRCTFLFNEHYIKDSGILPSKKVEKGFAIVNDNLKYQLETGSIKNQSITIYVDNIYYKDEIKLKIANTYTKENLTKITEYEKYDNVIYINQEDYEKLFKKPFYQSSVYVKDERKVDNTIDNLEDIGIKTKKASDYRILHRILNKDVQIIRIVKIRNNSYFSFYFISNSIFSDKNYIQIKKFILYNFKNARSKEKSVRKNIIYRIIF